MTASGYPLGNLLSHRRTLSGGPGVEFRTQSAVVALHPLTSDALRLRLRFSDPKRQIATSDRSYALLPAPWPGAELQIEETEDAVIVHAGQIMVRAERSPLRFSYARSDGGVFLTEVAGGGMRHDYWDVGLHFDLAEGEAFYGLGQADQGEGRAPAVEMDGRGQSAVPINHRGLRLPIWHWHQPPSRVVLPMLLSSRHYGLLIDNPVKACWDLGATDPGCFSYVTEGGLVDLIVFVGDSLVDLVETYTRLTGRCPLPPLWSLGYLQSRYGYRDEAELMALARKLRERGIPCDGLILDLHWFDRMGDLEFSRSRWPDPRAMIEALNGDGFHLTLIEEPYLTEHSRLYPTARARGFLARRPDGMPYLTDGWPGRMGLVDFTQAEARRWWGEEHLTLMQMGVDGYWLDLVEPMTHPIDMLHEEGPAITVHNRFADLMVSSLVEAWERANPGRRPFLMTRAAFAGAQRTGIALWSGDVECSWSALATQVALGQNAGLAGFAAWNSDVGGFRRRDMLPEDVTFSEEHECALDRPEDPELYVRWLQFGAFCPIFRIHSDQFRRREPWVFGEEIEAIARLYIRLRYRLLPYLYSNYYETFRSGLPVMRPLVLHYEDDPVAPAIADEYLFGRDLLIAPVLAPGARVRRVYLPAGRWYDGWTEESYLGPAWVEVEAPLDRIPMFVRAGGIVPFGPHQRWTGERALDPLTVHCYMGGEGHFDLYEDDGQSTLYRRGAYSLTPIRVAELEEGIWRISVGRRRGTFTGLPRARTHILWLHGMTEIGGIQRDDRPLPSLASREAWRKAKAGWWLHEEKRMIGVKLPPTSEPITLEVLPTRERGGAAGGTPQV